MKPIGEQSYYEIFEIPADATREQIEQAYTLAKKTYGDQSFATYSLFDSEERKEIIRKIHLAYETLSDENRREAYDRHLSGKPELQKPLRPVSEPGAPAPPVRKPESPRPVSEPGAPAPPVRKPESPRPVPRAFEAVDIGSLTGVDLRQIRERRGIPLQEIASRTRINITYLEFLEKNKFGSLPPAVYLRSYVAQYARLLDLDPGQVADRILFLVEQTKGSVPE